MRIAALIVLAGALLANASMASARTITARATAVTKTTIVTKVVRSRMHTRVHRHVAHRGARVFIRKRVGMLCVLPPDVQVALLWPGPACSYRDNFISRRDAYYYSRHRLVKVIR